ncbi:hypothetical protein [Nitratidesulfovibrio sp. 1201_IL3209]|uniref:hypothetical protein n=1 Tax=Nitratidesulfovibrio sp. 1201_IL3209 TaxID=3084053 RepID=UPI002FDA50A2
MDEKRYCVHAALGTRGQQLRLVRIRPEHCQCAGQDTVEQPGDGAAPAVGLPAEISPPDDPRLLPLPGARPVVLAEGLTARQADRLAALLSGLVDADASQPGDAAVNAPGNGSDDGHAQCIVPAQDGAGGIAVPEGAQCKAQAGLGLLREALLAVMACNPGGLTGPELLLALGLPGVTGVPGIEDKHPHGADLLVRGLLELLRGEGAVRHGEGR